MNVLFFVNDKVDFKSGVGKKILSQSSALERLSSEYNFVYAQESSKYRVVSDGEILKENFIFCPLILRYRFANLLDFIVRKKINLIYIRYTHFSSSSFLNFLHELKKNNVLIVLEFPTFPYDSEYKSLGLSSKIKLIIDKIYRVRLKDCVDYAVTFTDSEYDILGIKTICISNAVDKSAIENRAEMLRNLKLRNVETYKTLVFTAVSSMHYWHGIDRLIYSIESYIKGVGASASIKFNIVGDGPELNTLKSIVIEKKLSKYVVFYGHLDGSELESVLLNTDIGVDSLGRFRSGNSVNNSLKSKEYLSYGLPILKSHIDYSIDNTKFVFNVPNDESIIDINYVIELYQSFLGVYQRSDVNQFCISNFTWDVQFLNILESISFDN